MKKTLIFIIVTLSVILCCNFLVSCSDDEENGIIGTSWKEKETDFNLVISFINENDVKISSGIMSAYGKYTYNESNQNGIFFKSDKSSPFSINGNILIFENMKFYKQ